jgi:putative intracellular protease/amidase
MKTRGPKSIGLVAAILAVGVLLMVGSSGDKPAVLLIVRGETTVNLGLMMGKDVYPIGNSISLGMMIEKEVTPIVNKLNEAGYAVVIASESGASIRAGGAELNVDKKLADVQIQDYVGVVIPCMAEMPNAIPKKAVEIIQSAHTRNLPLAAQNSGVLILGSAGMLDGKNYAIEADWKDLPKAGTFKGVGVVQDGNIVTSGTCPFQAAMRGLKDRTDEFVTTFIRMLKK